MKLVILSTLLAACLAAPQTYPQYTQQYVTPTAYRQQYVAPTAYRQQYVAPTAYRQQYVAPAAYQGAYRTRGGSEATAAILRSDSQVTENGYAYAYETENGIQAQESGVEQNGIEAQGAFSYTGDDGQVYSVRYTAGANGFQPEGAHLPTPPPIPAAIARSLELNARDEASGIYDDGSYNPAKYETGAGAGVAYPAVVAARYYPQNRPRY